jgi:hypothetical protein
MSARKSPLIYPETAHGHLCLFVVSRARPKRGDTVRSLFRPPDQLRLPPPNSGVRSGLKTQNRLRPNSCIPEFISVTSELRQAAKLLHVRSQATNFDPCGPSPRAPPSALRHLRVSVVMTTQTPIKPSKTMRDSGTSYLRLVTELVYKECIFVVVPEFANYSLGAQTNAS